MQNIKWRLVAFIRSLQDIWYNITNSERFKFVSYGRDNTDSPFLANAYLDNHDYHLLIKNSTKNCLFIPIKLATQALFRI